MRTLAAEPRCRPDFAQALTHVMAAAPRTADAVPMRTRAPGSPHDASPALACGRAHASQEPCSCLVEQLASLFGLHLQTLTDLAWLRYDVARLGGASPQDAVNFAVEAIRRQPALDSLRVGGFDAAGFERQLHEALTHRADRDAEPEAPPS